MTTIERSPASVTLTRILALAALLFGAMTLKEGGAVLFVNGAARAAAGHYVPFVLIFNFAAGFVYILCGAGILLRRRWAHPVALLLAVSSGVILALLGIHILAGRAFEMRTVYAMAFRTSFWLASALVLHHTGMGQPAAERTVPS